MPTSGRHLPGELTVTVQEPRGSRDSPPGRGAGGQRPPTWTRARDHGRRSETIGSTGSSRTSVGRPHEALWQLGRRQPETGSRRRRTSPAGRGDRHGEHATATAASSPRPRVRDSDGGVGRATKRVTVRNVPRVDAGPTCMPTGDPRHPEGLLHRSGVAGPPPGLVETATPRPGADARLVGR